MTNNIEFAKEKTLAFLDAYQEMQKKLASSDRSDLLLTVEIDENYILAVIFDREVWAIATNDGGLRFWYDGSDDWTLGDLMGGYMDLYIKR